MDPILSVHLVEMGMKEENVGFVWGFFGLSYAMGSPVAGWLCEVVKSRQIVILLGLLLMSLSIAVAGPSLLLPNKLWLVMVGVFGMGFFGSFMFVPVLPEVIAVVKESYLESFQNLSAEEKDEKYKKVSSALADKASACNNISYALGSTLGPILGGFMSDHLGYRPTFDAMALACLGFCAVNFCFFVFYRVKSNETKVITRSEVLHTEIEECTLLSNQ